MPETLDCVVGRPFDITVETVSAAGYEWQPEFDAAVLALMQRSFDAPRPEIGAAVAQRLTFVALRPGPAEIRLELRRPWEQTAQESRVVLVRATPESG